MIDSLGRIHWKNPDAMECNRKKKSKWRPRKPTFRRRGTRAPGEEQGGFGSFAQYILRTYYVPGTSQCLEWTGEVWVLGVCALVKSPWAPPRGSENQDEQTELFRGESPM